MRILFMTINKSPERLYHRFLDRAMAIADDEEKQVIQQLRNWDGQSIQNFANEFVKQKESLFNFFQDYNSGITYNNKDIENCIKKYKQFLWSKKKIKSLYILPVWNIDETFYYKDDTYEVFNNFTTIYKPKYKFYQLQCLGTNKSIDENNVISVTFNNDVYEYSLGILYEDNTFVIQNKQLFLQEINWSDSSKVKKSLSDYKLPKKKSFPFIPIVSREQDIFSTNYGESLKSCVAFYRLLPWLKEKVKSIYIYPLLNIDESFYIKSDTFTQNDITFYKPKEKYYILQCSSRNKIQNANTTIINIGDTTYEFTIGILYESGKFILQNEDIYNAETNFIKEWIGNYEERKEKLLFSEIITPEAKTIAKVEFLNSLKEVTDKNVDIIYTDTFMDKLIDYIADRSLNIKSFFKKIANIVAYINPINIKLVGTTIFSKRLLNMYYNMDIISHLTEKEKLPEIYEDTRISPETLEQVGNRLYEFIDAIQEELIGNLLEYETIPVRKWTITKSVTSSPIVPIELPSWKSACVNKNDVDNLNDEDLIFYNENSKVYCFPINDLLYKFTFNDTINPYTGNTFDSNFTRRILSVYKQQSIKSSIPNVIDTSILYNIEEGPLIDLIEKRLEELEKSIERFSDTKCKACSKPLIKGEGLETIIRNKRTKFCGLNCFESKQW
ncbi:hypothetical protein AGMMS49579_01410 [Spirochaetia bacterium]|nr:hypothetical protein AGMMS49579_01410 [Spirochaetia bacterium]